jgi:hypothetical protein
VGSKASHTKGTEVVCPAKAVGKLRCRLALTRWEDSLLRPASGSKEKIALLEFRRLGLEHFSQSASTHDLSDLDGRDVETGFILHVTEPATLGRVIGEVLGLHEHFVVFEFGYFSGLDGEGSIGALEDRQSTGLVVQNPLASLDHVAGV